MLESQFQRKLIEEIKERLPGCVITKNDPSYIQGFPDLTIFYNDRYGLLECKRSEGESHRPNQDYHVERMDEMSFARFIYPENKEEVLHELERSLKAERTTRISKRK